MSRRALAQSGVQLARLAKCSGEQAVNSGLPACLQQTRPGSSVPEFYGKPSPYSAGTQFLGTPKDHLERIKHRPVSPHVFEVDAKGFHYAMPINAISSITNRATGVALTAAAGGAGFVALVGDLPATVDAIRHTTLLLYPLKAAIAFPLVYHYLGGLRHIVWEKHTIGKQADKKSYLENEVVDRTSRAIFAASIAATLGLVVYSS